MSHYDFHRQFREVYDRALASFRRGAKNADTLLPTDDVAFLQSIGGRAQDMFDYAEDAENSGEPDFATALMIEFVRRDYFLNVQHGEVSREVLAESSLPAKTDAVRGIGWLPRIIPKTKAKLRGELPQDLMYCCGGDRKFFRSHDIHPAEFLRAVWACEADDEKLIDWFISRSKNAVPAGA